MSFTDGDLLIFCTPAECWRKQSTLGNPTHFLFAALADALTITILTLQINKADSLLPDELCVRVCFFLKYFFPVKFH